jgi:hypothetical protein
MNNPSKVIYEMGYRASEFADVLGGQFSGETADFSHHLLSQNHWQVTRKSTGFAVDISVSEQADRVLGLFRLPVLKVVFSMSDDKDESAQAFFHRFHQYFHKGGG